MGSKVRRFLICVLFAALTSRHVVEAGPLDVFRPNRSPTRIAAGPDGRIYATDALADAVFIYDSGLNVVGELKSLSFPLGIAVDRQGNIYVGNKGRKNVEVYSPAGSKIRAIGADIIRFPNDMCFDLDENLYVVDSAQGSVLVYTTSGQLLRVIGTAGEGAPDGFKFPSTITIAYRRSGGENVGELFVGDRGNLLVKVFDLQGNFQRSFGGLPIEQSGFPYPDYDWQGTFTRLQSLAVDDEYRIHALDAQLNNVQILNAQDGSYITAYGKFGAAAGELNVPLDILITDDSKVLAANFGKGKVEVIRSLANTVVTLTDAVIEEGLPSDSVVGVLGSTPAPVGTNVFLMLAGQGDTDNSLFYIDGTNLKTSATFDREVKSSYRVRIKSVQHSSSNLVYAEQLTITVGNVNEWPTGVSLDSALVYEHEPAGTVVGNFVTTDADVGDTYTYTLVAGSGGTDNASFAVSSNGLSLETTAEFDYEVKSSYSVRVKSEDGGGLSCTNPIAITVVNVIEETGDADIDNDGMPDRFEWDNTGTYTDLLPNVDSDGDGMVNLGEWIALTDPVWALDVLRIEEHTLSVGTNEPVLRWSSKAGRNYDVLWADSLTNSFSTLATNLPATPPQNVYTDAVHGVESKGFYLIKAKLP